MNKKVFILIAILSLALFAGCSTAPPSQKDKLPAALEKYQTSQDASEVRAMLLDGNGAASDQPLLSQFAEWGSKNRKAFLDIIQYDDLKQKKEVGRGIAVALVQANKHQQFQADFRSENSEVLNIIRAQIVVAQKAAGK